MMWHTLPREGQQRGLGKGRTTLVWKSELGIATNISRERTAQVERKA